MTKEDAISADLTLVMHSIGRIVPAGVEIRRRMVIRKLLIITLLWPLAYASAEVQASKAPSNAMSAVAFQLKGVLISESRRLALVNGTVAREGERVGNAQILRIRKDQVHILAGSREFVVRVGSTAEPAGQPAIRLPSTKGHKVKRGETLSGISQRYLGKGVNLNQMMIALFETNPQAFNGNINILYEGAVLRIPDVAELHRQSSDRAMAEVIRHENAWRNGEPRQPRVAAEPNPRQYGPVSSGETLSGIAARLRREGVTLNQMMLALYRANPKAFSGNIDVLHKGAILRIPNKREIGRLNPQVATAFNHKTAPILDTADQSDSCRLIYQRLRPDRPGRPPAEPGVPSRC